MSANPRTPKGRRTRELLVEAGRVVFARDGYVDARMSDVAVEADISMGGLYRYFKNKEDLFAQVIADLHEQLYVASTASDHDFGADPFSALLEANTGYLRLYRQNRGVMRAFIQAAHVEPRFRDFWWQMRERHIDRFVAALAARHHVTEVNGVPARIIAESLACMVEQSAYVWFAQEELRGSPISIDEAARGVSLIWFETFFASDPAAVS